MSRSGASWGAAKVSPKGATGDLQLLVTAIQHDGHRLLARDRHQRFNPRRHLFADPPTGSPTPARLLPSALSIAASCACLLPARKHVLWEWG